MSESNISPVESNGPFAWRRAYELSGVAEGTETHMSGLIVPGDALPVIYLESNDSIDTVYADLGQRYHVRVAKVIRRAQGAIIEYGMNQPFLSGKVALATTPHQIPDTLLIGSFKLLDTELGTTSDYSLTARIQELAPDARWLQGKLSPLQ